MNRWLSAVLLLAGLALPALAIDWDEGGGGGGGISAVAPSDLTAGNEGEERDVLTLGADDEFTWATPSYDGWSLDTDVNTWTGLGTSSFTIDADMTSILEPGDPIKMVQSATTKYFYVNSVAYSSVVSTVTVVLNADYTLASGAITTGYYSHQQTPDGFPDWFNFTTTYVGFSANPVPSTIRYKIDGRLCTVQIYATTNGTSNATAFNISLPVTSKNLSAGANGVGPWTGASSLCVNNGSVVAAGTCNWNIIGSTNTAVFVLSTSATGWANANAKAFTGVLQYEW